jgi:hypothetical protein
MRKETRNLTALLHRLSDTQQALVARWLSRHPGAENPNEVFEARLTRGERIAD